jgi:hypothetical protein
MNQINLKLLHTIPQITIPSNFLNKQGGPLCVHSRPNVYKQFFSNNTWIPGEKYLNLRQISNIIQGLPAWVVFQNSLSV